MSHPIKNITPDTVYLERTTPSRAPLILDPKEESLPNIPEQEISNTIRQRPRMTLEMMTKNFPPFPPGSEDRIKFLEQCLALKKLFDSLTVPPENVEELSQDVSLPLDMTISTDRKFLINYVSDSNLQ